MSVSAFLPVWAQPHRFRAIHLDPGSVGLVHPSQLGVFTFGLILNDLHTLTSAEGVRRFGRRWGYEWLPDLSAGVQHEQHEPLPQSQLAAFLSDRAGFGPNRTLWLDFLNDEHATTSDPDDAILSQFAETDGALIHQWALNAFYGLDLHLRGWAQQARRVGSGYRHAATKRLDAQQIPHRLTEVTAIDGKRRPARRYDSLYERAALELEDLAVLQPRLRTCPLCHQPYVPITTNQHVCATNLYLTHRPTPIGRCVPTIDPETQAQAERDDYRRRRKTAWTRARRAQQRHHPDSTETKRALAKWESWQRDNPPPRRPGRPPNTNAPKAHPEGNHIESE
jgi:hypothetical protein